MIKKLLVATIFLVIITLPLTLQHLIKINKVKCISDLGACPEEIVNEAGRYQGKSYFKAKKELSKYLLANLMVNSYAVSYKIPEVLFLDITIVVPRYSILDTNTNTYYLISEEGYCIKTSDNSTFPTLKTSNFNLKIGQKIDDTTLKLLKTVEGVSLMFTINSGTFTSDGLVVELNEGVKVLFPLDKDPDTMLGSLKLIYFKIQSDIEKYREIDLRYSNPILR